MRDQRARAQIKSNFLHSGFAGLTIFILRLAVTIPRSVDRVLLDDRKADHPDNRTNENKRAKQVYIYIMYKICQSMITYIYNNFLHNSLSWGA